MLSDGVNEIIEDLDDDLLETLVEDLLVQISHIERYMMGQHLVFGQSSNTNRISQDIMSRIKAINMICQQTFLDPLLAFMQVIEDFFYHVCSGKCGQSRWISELMLLLIDGVRGAFDELKLYRTLDVQLLDGFRGEMKVLMGLEKEVCDDSIKNVISTFSNLVHPDLVFSVFEIDQELASGEADLKVDLKVDLKAEGKVEVESGSLPVREKVTKLMPGGIKLFEDLAQTLDARSIFWTDRAAFILHAGLLINSYLPSKVNETQLTAAIYMHDVGMGLLPDSFLFKDSKYTSEDIMLLQQHPLHIYELMLLMPEWQEAAEMVHQHHERFDGEGYPNAIAGADIDLGASVIAVADAFYSLTHDRSDRGFKKSLRRSITEINKCNGTQFSPVVVEAFNQFLMNKCSVPIQ